MDKLHSLGGVEIERHLEQGRGVQQVDAMAESRATDTTRQYDGGDTGYDPLPLGPAHTHGKGLGGHAEALPGCRGTPIGDPAVDCKRDVYAMRWSMAASIARERTPPGAREPSPKPESTPSPTAHSRAGTA